MRGKLDSFETVALSGGVEKSRAAEYFGGTAWCVSGDTQRS